MTSEDFKELGSAVLRNYGRFLKEQNATCIELLKMLKIKPLDLSKFLHPINIDIEPFEGIDLLDVIESDNKNLKKIIATFSFLCCEIRKLQEEANSKYYYFVALYNENFRQADITPEEFICMHIEDLCRLNAFVKRCHDIVVNLTRQIYGLAVEALIDLRSLKFDFIFSKLGDLLLILVTLDNLIHSSSIHNHWTLYRRTVKFLYKDQKCNEALENFKSMDVILGSIEEKILSDKIFEHCIDSLVQLNVKMALKQDMFIVDEFTNYLKKIITDLDKSLVDFYESTSSVVWIKANILFVFHTLVFGNADKKVLKTIMDVNVKAHSVPLFGLVVWYPEQFLSRYIPFLVSNLNKLSHSIGKARQAYITNKKQNLSKDVYNAQIQISKWSLNMNETFSVQESQLNLIQMNHRTELLNQGVKYASQIKHLVTCFISLHISQSIPITKNSITCICKLIEILKCIECVFLNNYLSISTSTNLIVQHMTYQIISKLMAAKKTMMIDKNYSKQRLDEITALVVVERALRGPLSLKRRVVINVALCLVPSHVLSDLAYTTILERIEASITVQKKMEELCNCVFLYWNKFILSHYLHQLITSKKDMKRLILFVKALNDSFRAIRKCDISSNKNEIVVKYFDQMNDLFSDSVIKHLGQEIETNLRLHTHTHLKLDKMDPFTTSVVDVSPILKLPTFRLDNQCMSITHGIEHYLSYTFYNLTTVVLHDWRTYVEMRQLGDLKFELKTVDDNLPTQTLEQGLDVLEIMRNIHVFVSKYLYNLNNQIFIEQSSNSKTLNTINIIHIANSIRTHGTGVMSTTVNFTYQFLRKKFHIFSQFMYDEQIKSRLIKDMRYFRESSNDSEQMYSYKRAEKFNKGIRNLGLDDGGRSYLDLFRILITEIGNAMGYVRMVRSGGLHCCANASAFLPSLDDSWSFDEFFKDSSLSEPTIDATKNLENTINNLISNFFHGTDYFKLFVNVFSPIFRNPNNAHLKTFFIIVPPLTLNFVENILLCKDKMNKKNISGAAFTDDGFAMGLAYILKLLDQEQEIDSLHWFESVNKHIAQERKNVEEQLSKGSSQGHQALALTQKKLSVLEQEFQFLYFSFSSARIFFQAQ